MKDVLENKLYPGFDLTFSDLKAIKAEKKDTVNIIDYSSMIWVREAIEHLVKEIDDKYKIQFVEPTEADLDLGNKVINIYVPFSES